MGSSLHCTQPQGKRWAEAPPPHFKIEENQEEIDDVGTERLGSAVIHSGESQAGGLVNGK